MTGTRFTTSMLDKYAGEWKLATRHPFLTQAGLGTIKKETLEAWCRQDYLYAFTGYLPFASALLSRLPYPANPPAASSSRHDQTLARAIPLLIQALQGVQVETEFFKTNLAENGMALHPDGALPQLAGKEAVYEDVTRQYVGLMHRAARELTLEEGLVLLWTMEEAYFQAWGYAKSHMPAEKEDESEVERARRKFINNWTNDDFAAFVKECGEVVDGLELSGEAEAQCEEMFKTVVELEQRFWGDVE